VSRESSMALFFVLLAACGGCVSYGSGLYTLSEGYQAHAQDVHSALTLIVPTRNPVGGKAKVLIQTQDGLKASVYKALGLSEDTYERHIRLSHLYLQSLTEAVKKRGIFDLVEVSTEPSYEYVPIDVIGDADFLISIKQRREIIGGKSLTTFVGNRNSPRTFIFTFDLDKNRTNANLVLAWVNDLENYARSTLPTTLRTEKEKEQPDKAPGIVLRELPQKKGSQKEDAEQGNANLGGSTEIPLEKRGGVYELPVKINGVITLKFILDTGASEVNIPADVALTLLRTGTVTQTDFLPGKSYQLADGSILKSSRLIIRELDLGGIKITQVPASIGPATGSLLLGQSLLGRLESWSLDNKRNLVIVGPGTLRSK
jgi:clan AA aspartic protease (TIGR02281 family)